MTALALARAALRNQDEYLAHLQRYACGATWPTPESLVEERGRIAVAIERIDAARADDARHEAVSADLDRQAVRLVARLEAAE